MILSEAEFIETNFKGAILTDAILQVSDLQGASLVNAQHLYSTILYETANLTGTDFDGASFGDTSFASVDLSKVKGLSKTKHHEDFLLDWYQTLSINQKAKSPTSSCVKLVYLKT